MINPWAFFITIGILVVAHEFGHYRVARAFGVKVLRFSVGFGPVLLRYRAAGTGTEFTLAALPLGGFVKMLDTREEPCDAGAVAQAFDRQSLFARSCIVLAGPVANLVLAVLLFTAAAWWGMEEPQAVLAQPRSGSVAALAGLSAGDRVEAYAEAQGEADWQAVESMAQLREALWHASRSQARLRLRISDASGAHHRVVELPLARLGSTPFDEADWEGLGIGVPFSAPLLGDIRAGGPAALAGLQRGDRILAIDGQPVPDALALRASIRAFAASSSASMLWELEREGQLLSVPVTPRIETQKDGTRVGRVDAMVGGAPAVQVLRRGPWDGLQLGASRTVELASLSLRTMGQMLVGTASLRNLSGPLTIADYAGASVERGLAYYLGFLGVVSVSLGVLNLLPLPLLDGGHLIYYFYEGLTGRPVSGLWLAWLQRGGALVLLLIMSVALSNDVARLLGLQ